MGHRVGPCHVFYGDPTTASGADMTYLGITRGDVTVEPNLNIALGRADQSGATPRADAVYTTGPSPVVGVPLVDEAKAKLAAYILSGEESGTAFAFGSGFAQIAEASIGTLCLLPIDETDEGTNGIDSPNAVWLPAALARNIGSWTFSLPDGDDAFSPRDTQFAGLYRSTDHDSTAIPEAGRVMFIGPPDQVDAGLTWSLPAVS